MHGNSNANTKRHHVYLIWDESTDDIFKYGMSHDPIDEDGLSERCREQVAYLNLVVDWPRFYGRILISDIPNRVLAKKIEQNFINAYERQFGRKPRGNLD